MSIKIVLLLTSLFTFSMGMTCPGAMEEGESTTLTCQSDTSKFTWELKLTTGYTTILECANDTCSNDEYTVTTRQLTSGNGVVYESRLRIKRVQRNKITYKCRPVDETCEIEVYVRPRAIYCGAAAGHHGLERRSYFETECTVEESYPKANCFMKMTTTNGAKYEYKMTSFNSVQQPNGNYRTSYSYSIPFAGLQPGIHYFMGFAYPGVSVNVSSALVVDSTMYSIHLEAPTVRLSKDCPFGEISGNTTCSCEMTDQGYPEGWIKWFTSSDYQTGTVVSDSLTRLTLSQTSIASRPTFTCSPVSTLGRLGPGHVYTPVPAARHCKCPEFILLKLRRRKQQD